MNIDTKALIVLREILEQHQELSELKPSEIVEKLWSYYISNYDSNNNLNGAVFEEIIGFVLTREKCLPFFMQAKASFIPGVNYDFILFSEDEGPITLSIKTSLRERWKQADLEAFVMKNVHKGALCYLITMDKREAEARNLRRKDCIGLDGFILGNTTEFDELINFIKERKLVIPAPVDVIISNTILDDKNASSRYAIKSL